MPTPGGSLYFTSMRVAVIDTYYESFRRSFPIDQSSSYDKELARVLQYAFATADFYSRNLRALGHEVIDIVVDWPELQGMWARENGNPTDTMRAQLETFGADCVILQDLSIDTSRIPGDPLVAAQCSCRTSDRRPNIDLLFTSFPFYVKRFQDMGIPAVYLPLAFEPRMLDGEQQERDIDISCVAGANRNGHWRQGTDTLEVIASAFKQPERTTNGPAGEPHGQFQWFGYGLENLPATSHLRACYRGQAWGRQMYDIYRRSKIVFNRHGEIANGFTNNLRAFESCGMGALLLTEQSSNLRDLFPEGTCVAYDPSDPWDAPLKIKYYLEHEDERAKIAAAGQKHVLENHTYRQRMEIVSDVLKGMLVAA